MGRHAFTTPCFSMWGREDGEQMILLHSGVARRFLQTQSGYRWGRFRYIPYSRILVDAHDVCVGDIHRLLHFQKVINFTSFSSISEPGFFVLHMHTHTKPYYSFRFDLYGEKPETYMVTTVTRTPSDGTRSTSEQLIVALRHRTPMGPRVPCSFRAPLWGLCHTFGVQ